jgi:hypothetical protein
VRDRLPNAATNPQSFSQKESRGVEVERPPNFLKVKTPTRALEGRLSGANLPIEAR